MKAEKVLERYRAGERDFRGENLQGQSFKDRDLSEADFSKAKIQGANFTNANLKGANFSCAEAGLQHHWAIVLVISSWLLAAASGFLSAYLGYLVALIFDSSDPSDFTASIVTLIMLAVFFILVIRQGFGAGVVAVAVAGVVAVAGAEVVAVAGAVAVAGVVAVAGAVAVARAVAEVFAAGAVAVAGAGTGAITLLSAYIGWRALAGDEKHASIKNIAIAFAATGGTNFRGADLTDANFTQATLKNTNFRDADLTRTRFYETEKLDLARVGNSILATQAVLRLLVSGNGRGKPYGNANLRGANLIGADLKEANLKNADISEATFEGACLEWANLTLTQAVGTNFTSAQMTGACVEAWNIEYTTILDNVDCRFIYLLEHPKLGTDDRERRPNSGEFKPGEFTKLFQEVFDTVDLIFRNGIDWKAFVNAFKKVQVENEDIELEIQSIENKGDGVVVVKVNVPPGTNKERIHSEFTQAYERGLEVGKTQGELNATKKFLATYRVDMKEVVDIIAKAQITNLNQSINLNNEAKATAEGKVMNESSDRKIEITGGTVNASGAGAFSLGDISGTVANTINQLPASPEPDKPGIKELLEQLKAAIESEPNLSEEDKAEALEQVQVLAEAGQKPQEGGMQKSAKTAIKILRGTVDILPSTATLVEASSNLLPLITKLFGLG